MKDDPQSDPDMWKVLKAKFEKTSIPSESGKQNVFCKRDHDDRYPPLGERQRHHGAVRDRDQETSKASKTDENVKKFCEWKTNYIAQSAS
ncbi:hypothetical protein Tco_1526924 [Tanacetum coccineum]